MFCWFWMRFVVVRLTLLSAMEPSPEPLCLAVLLQVNDRCLFGRRNCVFYFQCCCEILFVLFCLKRHYHTFQWLFGLKCGSWLSRRGMRRFCMLYYCLLVSKVCFIWLWLVMVVLKVVCPYSFCFLRRCLWGSGIEGWRLGLPRQRC